MEEVSAEEWWRRKQAIADYALEQWKLHKKPVIVIVVPETANIFNCVLADKIHSKRGHEVHLAYEGEGLHKNPDWIVLYEAELWQMV